MGIATTKGYFGFYGEYLLPMASQTDNRIQVKQRGIHVEVELKLIWDITTAWKGAIHETSDLPQSSQRS